jgi:hypothetical protein
MEWSAWSRRRIGTSYPGAEDRRVRPVPIFIFTFRYHDIFLSLLGLGWNAIDVGGLRAGPVLRYEGGRSQSLDPRLNGLGDIPGSITGGAFVAYRLAPFELLVMARRRLRTLATG